MEIKYQLFEKENLVVQKFTGIFSIEKYIRYNRYIMENLAIKPIKKVLIDFRDILFSELTDELPDDYADKLELITEIRKNINKNELKNKDVTLVIWVDKPLPTVVAHLFIDNFQNQNYSYCSTEENIRDILKIPEHLNDLKNIVNNLDNTF